MRPDREGRDPGLGRAAGGEAGQGGKQPGLDLRASSDSHGAVAEVDLALTAGVGSRYGSFIKRTEP
jgi:hypothetical protein